MRSIYTLTLLRFAILTFTILTAISLEAQRKVMPPNEVHKIENELAKLPVNTQKVYILLNLSYTYFYRHTPKFQDLNKAMEYAKQALSFSKSLGYNKGVGESYLLISMVSQEAKNYLQGKEYATKAIKVFMKLSESDLLGESRVMLWSTSTLLGENYDTRVTLLNDAAEDFNLSGNKVREADCLKELGDIYQIEGDYAHALIVLNKAMDLYNEAGYKRLQYVYDLMGRVYLLIGNLDKGIEYIMKAEDAADEEGDNSIFISTLNNSIALAYNRVNEPYKALPYCRKALETAMEFDDFEQVIIILSTNINILTRIGNTSEALELISKTEERYPAIKNRKDPNLESLLANIYLARNDLPKAAVYCKTIERKIKTYGPELNKDDIFSFFNSLICYNIAVGNYKKASIYNDKYDSLCNIRNRANCNLYDLWKFKIDSAAGNYLPAIQHFQRYKEINDEMLSEAKIKQINQLTILHESEKKDKNIELLQEQAISQQSRIESANFLRNTSMIGFLLLIIFISFMYKNYRDKQKINIALSLQKEEINSKNEELQHLVTEKEWLLREIHHRVKNNLHMVVGLLAGQGEYLKSEEAVEAIKISQSRIEAMSIIHQKLYQSENLSMIDMPSYVYELTENLAESFEQKNKIHFQLDICKVEFPLSHSIPIGLIINEAITNAIKHAFLNLESGNVEIILNNERNNHFVLKIRDNGKGIGKKFSVENCSSLGIRLIAGLCGDMQGEFKITDDNGTQIELRFTTNDI